MFVSMIMPSCNQGEELHRTIESAKKAMGRLEHEIIVVDDQSSDGSIHGLPYDVTVIRTEHREGVSASRRLGYSLCKGDMLLWSDPHCRYPAFSFEKLVELASQEEAIFEPRIQSEIGQKIRTDRYGGVLAIGDRALNNKRQHGKPHPYPSLEGTVYAMQRSVYEKLGGWPRLPGVWGYSEQAMTLMSFFLGIPIKVVEDIVCVHKQHNKFPFRVDKGDPARNGHFILKAFFPDTYDSFWVPKLDEKWGNNPDYLTHLKGGYFRTVTKFLAKRRKKTEEDFYKSVLGIEKPDSQGKTKEIEVKPEKPKQVEVEQVEKSEVVLPFGHPDNDEYLKRQSRNSKPKEYGYVHSRTDNSLLWFNKYLSGGIKGKSVLDIGSRDGYTTAKLAEYEISEVKGIEVVPEVAEYAASQGRPVFQGDVRDINCHTDAYDLVTCLHTLEHCPEPELALHEMIRVLKPGGWILIAVPREQEPRLRFGHYCSFPNSEVLNSFVCNHPSLDIKTWRKKVSRNNDKHLEIRAMIQKREDAEGMEKLPKGDIDKVESKVVEDVKPEFEVKPASREQCSLKIHPEFNSRLDMWSDLSGNNVTGINDLAEAFNEAKLEPYKRLVTIGEDSAEKAVILSAACVPGATIAMITLGESRRARHILRGVRTKLNALGYNAQWLRADPNSEDAIEQMQGLFRDELPDLVHFGINMSSPESFDTYSQYEHSICPNGLMLFPSIFSDRNSYTSPTLKVPVSEVWDNQIKPGQIFREIRYDKPRQGYGIAWKFSAIVDPVFEEALKWVKDNNITMHQNRAEIALAYQEAKKVKAKTFVEVGSYQGGSLWILAQTCSPGAKIIVNDNGETRQQTRENLVFVVEELKKKGFDAVWIQRDMQKSDSLVKKDWNRDYISQHKDSIQKTYAAIGDGEVDLMHIDGDHRTGKTQSDYDNYTGLVRPGGLVIFHDALADPIRKSVRVFECWEKIKWTGRAIELRRNLPEEPEDKKVHGEKRRGFGLLWKK